MKDLLELIKAYLLKEASRLNQINEEPAHKSKKK